MLLELKKLFDSLQSVFDFDPIPKPAFRLSFSQGGQTAALTIENHTLTTATTGGAEALNIELKDWLFDRLAEEINTKTGYTATVLNPKFNTMLAASLLDGIKDYDLGVVIDLPIATNPLWILLKPVALAVEFQSGNIDQALTQLNILTSQTFFADFWGRFLGVVRKEGEGDVAYTQRIVNRILLLRANNKAIEQIVSDELGITVEVRDLLPEVLNINNTPVFSRIPGQVFNVGNFLVDGPFGGQPLINLVNRHKAGGTRAFFRQRLDVEITDAADSFVVDIVDVSLFDTIFADRDFSITVDVDGDISEVDTGLQSWVVGETPMPGSVIG